jgi:hypothetical protein
MDLDSKLLFQPSCHLVQVKAARLDGDAVAGVFGDEGRQLTNPILLCESFLNCRSNEDVLRFTKRYGPLFLQLVDLSPMGLPFSFPVKEWLEFQYNLKSLWGARTDSLSFPVGKDHNSESLDESFVLSRKKGSHEFVFGDLSRLINFLVHVLPADRQRACARPGCGTYFFASDLKQTYCGDRVCKHWAELRSKNAWWKRNAVKRRALRKTGR